MPDIAPFEAEFAHSVAEAKYMRPHGETHWSQLASRVVAHPMAALVQHSGRTYGPESDALFDLVDARKFIPGGRYLYACGNDFHQTQNCLLLACEDTREGWADLAWKAEMSLLTGAGIGAYWGKVRPNGSIVGRTAGTASGPVPKMISTNEQGRAAVQGGDRRSAIWAGLPWQHADVFWFMRVKDWPEYLKLAKDQDPSIPAPMDMTNISVCLDDEFFAAFNNPDFAGGVQQYDGAWTFTAPDGGSWHEWARRVYWTAIDGMTQTGEPGFTVDLGDKRDEKLRNACVPGEVEILTTAGYVPIESVAGYAVDVWNGEAWSRVIVRETGQDRPLVSVLLDDGSSLECTPNHTWVLSDGTRVRATDLEAGDSLCRAEFPVVDYGVEPQVDAYTQGFYEGDGVKNRDLIWVYDPKASVIDRLDSSHVADKSTFGRRRVRPTAVLPKGSSPISWSLTGRLDWLAGLLDADATVIERGGVQLATTSPELARVVKKLLTTLGGTSEIRTMREAGERQMPDGKGGHASYSCQHLERVLIPSSSVQRLVEAGLHCERLDLSAAVGDIRRNSRFVRVSDVLPAGVADKVYCFTEPDLNMGVFEGVLTGQCTEIVSADDSDICNLGGLSLARFDSPDEFEEAVRLGTLYLTAGTVYSHVPYPQVEAVRDKNRRLGLDLLGVHEFLLRRGLTYGSDDGFEALEPYMAAYRRGMEFAHDWQHEAGLSLSVAVTSGAPTGTRGIVGETTTSWEPVFAAAYRRGVITSKAHMADERTMHYVVDPTVARLMREGLISPSDEVEDSYSLAHDYERRFAMQAYAQANTDQAISMTINLPHVMRDAAERRQFGETLYRYLPQLRGITVYPDGARAGQPITKVSLSEAVANGAEVYESDEKCASGVCGI